MNVSVRSKANAGIRVLTHMPLCAGCVMGSVATRVCECE